ncbi:MAG: hypothetical protein WAT12_02180, partial [Candidatus Nitrotoga sp.]
MESGAPKWMDKYPWLKKPWLTFVSIAAIIAVFYYWGIFYEFVSKQSSLIAANWFLFLTATYILLAIYSIADSRKKFSLRIDQSFKQGVDQGIEQGVEQGIKQGIAQGVEQGIDQGRKLEQQDRQTFLFEPLRKSFSEIQSQFADNQTPEKIEPIISA